MSRTINDAPNNMSTLNITFTNKYAMTFAGVGELCSDVTTTTIFDNLEYLFTKPADYLVSLRYYPFAIEPLFIDGATGFQKINVGSSQFSAGVTGREFVLRMSNVLDMGSITIPRVYNNFLDYSPYTTIECFLPYIGIITLPTNEVMGKKVYFKYVVDFDTGNATANIIVDDTIIMMCDGKIGFEFPLGSSNSIEVSRNMLMTGIGLVGGVASAGIAYAGNKHLGSQMIKAGSIDQDAREILAGQFVKERTAIRGGEKAVDLLANSTVGIINGMQQSVNRFGSSDTKNYLRLPQNVYLIIKRPNPIYPTMYNHFVGRPSGVTKKLDTLMGYTEISSFRLTDVVCTSSEYSMIRDILDDGVIFPDKERFSIYYHGNIIATVEYPDGVTFEQLLRESITASDYILYLQNNSRYVYFNYLGTVYLLLDNNNEPILKTSFITSSYGIND